MILTESHTLKATIELNNLCFLTKNLYNKANYIIRQEFILNGKFIQKYDLYHIVKSEPEYKALPARVSRGVLRVLNQNWLSFFSCIKKWKSNKSLFKGKPNLPKYLPKTGKFTAIFFDTAILKPKGKYKSTGTIGFSSLKLRIKSKIEYKNIIEVHIIPIQTGKYKINIAYDYKEEKLKQDNKIYASIDLGVNNLMTITSNKKELAPLIINGRPLKSINQYYNKKKGEIQSKFGFHLNENQVLVQYQKSKKLDLLTFKRENKIKDYLHKSSDYLIKYLLRNEINTLVVGYNEYWKQGISIGKENNQKFVQIPFLKLVEMLKYKCEKTGINFILNEESYTSKASFLNLDEIPTYIKGNYEKSTFSGYRVKRGLYKIKKKKKYINADVNASYNIMRKAVPNIFKDGIEGVVVHPKVFTLKR